jgi:hypothetical protein
MMMDPRINRPGVIQFEGWRVPPGFLSDGCTLARDGNRNRYTPACVLHDFLRRYGIVPVYVADDIFRRHLIALGASRCKARAYWVGVRVLSVIFTRTEPLPFEWREFSKPVRS